MYIYKITNLSNNKIYIGKTIRSEISIRWKQHIQALKRGNHDNSHLQRAWNKYGEQSFSFEVIETFNSEHNFDLNNLEIFWINYYKSTDPKIGYNKTFGGDGLVATEEILRKMSKFQKEFQNRPEIKLIKSKTHKGKIVSLESRLRMSKAKKGRRASPESVAKMIATRKGKPTHPNTIKAILDSNIKKRKKILCIETGVIFESLSSTARIMSLSVGNLHSHLKGKQKHVNGFTFTYVKELYVA